ncbi:MMPL family transporter [Cryptosporangium phraense]|uniref:MMPL family transporter n=1 Tax=Cryptosporangium phraense TaxID=2593070 RepID=A0A545AHX8_9ACTN|nr:MMPL family transporter [Cryptosporangium phraense]TQS40927.1 MMPL family transporter [Cryptosporangium phraense]
MDGLRKSSLGVPGRLAEWSARHRLLTIAGWLAAVVLAVVVSGAISGPGARSSDPGETGVAQRVLNRQDGAQATQENMLIGPADPAAVRSAVADLTAALRADRTRVAEVWSPVDASERLADGGRLALVTYQVGGVLKGSSARADAVRTLVDEVAARHPRTRFAQAGDRSLAIAVDRAIGADVRHSERISLPLTIVILLVVFGALVAASIPILLTATTLIATFALISIVDHWLAVNSAAYTMVLLIGVAVGVDYALFSVRRFREELAAGRDVRAAVRIAGATSGRVILVSGAIVVLCLSGLLWTGIDVFRGATAGIAIVVGVAVLGALTVLPAVLASLGHRVDRGRLPRRRGGGRANYSVFWERLATAVTRRPAVWGGAAALLLLAIAAPALGMHLQDAPVTASLPRSVPAIDAANRMNDPFPGAASPARVVVWSDDDRAVDPATVETALAGYPRVTATRYGDVVVARVPLPGDGTDRESVDALAKLRATTIDGLHVAVAGRTAFAADFADQLARRTPFVLVFVLGLAFVLLFVVFRSALVAAVSIALNLLSVGAAYGVLTFVFQDRTGYGGIVSWLPLFLFVLLFGLSMDYHLFLLSRIQERWPARTAIVDGVAASAGVISSAAVIMVAAFSIFMTLSAIEYRMLGVGAAVAILLDATVVRGVLLPAGLALLGERAVRPRSTGDPHPVVDTSSGTRHEGIPSPANADG